MKSSMSARRAAPRSWPSASARPEPGRRRADPRRRRRREPPRYPAAPRALSATARRDRPARPRRLRRGRGRRRRRRLAEGRRQPSARSPMAAAMPSSARCRPRNACPCPMGFSFAEAAALPEVFFTAWNNVIWLGRLAEGETLLVQGGTSGVGMAAIQIAQAAARRPRDRDRRLGREARRQPGDRRRLRRRLPASTGPPRSRPRSARSRSMSCSTRRPAPTPRRSSLCSRPMAASC